MPQDIKKGLIKIAQENGKMTLEEAEQFFASLEKQNRYMTETWF